MNINRCQGDMFGKEHPCECCIGPTGPQGERGPRGCQGLRGCPGQMGPVGPQGDTGATGPQGYPGFPGPRGDTGATGSAGPFLSSYIEAVGSAQTVEPLSNVAFNTDGGAVETVGGDFELDATGQVFSLRRAGLYHVEWNVIYEGSPILVGLQENGGPLSALWNPAQTGNHSSGALMNVTDDALPTTISLTNLNDTTLNLISLPEEENISASIRITRFADGPSD